ncbi:2-nitropropane dioxygenase (plasmid) [Synechocystis sp. PCC 6803]|uniref:2-nitropropane dioxygenase n=2 Tax=unclassified Synechocystis TaxID=2640012 RepID=Q6ZE58_SYNY3|nr:MULTISPECIES: nitronate monooxygenase [unclassified Synechocystis]AGF53694.1 2-nitropropane dioxygenase [Synechocystis sp. PCC 6803]AVP91544.1 nitronate monooxygenase [Synechocystis sp. IPPAS B-1465]MBD2619705.1 nitronate monooxygenase [Synechocystis sp. FACHB-898]MBD2640715.1 nitronate monooxygenase [Synechocystis sp. FACHB-908]MBD2662420.1 nitronate monooxygenase [Synechocystis sp. FACHB-929]
MLTTQITQTYHLTTPIISAGMAFVATPKLAAAVSNAGGMGTFSAFMSPPEELRALIRQTRSLSDRPFGIDFITAAANDDHIAICMAERVPVVIFFWSFPPLDWVTQLQNAGVKVWMQVGSLAEATQAKAQGFDAIIAQGQEGGGHNRSEASIFSLLPAICREVAPIPVIAAGGIIDGRGLVAALALGAEAVWCGTRFLASEEAYAHPEYKARVVTATVGDTTRTTLFGPEMPGQLMRVLRNLAVNQWGDRVADATKHGPTQPAIGSTILGGQALPMPKFSAILPTPDTSGDFEEMCLTAGESSGNITAIKSARDILWEMENEALDLLTYRLQAITKEQNLMAAG